MTIWIRFFLCRPKNPRKRRNRKNSPAIIAGSGTAERTDSLAKRIETQHFFVAVSENDEIVGFASFEEPDYLDMMYVHKDFQLQGVGNSLLAAIREKASEVGAEKIVSDVSITAKPFFEQHGFRVVKKQAVRINDVELTNYRMENLLCKSK